MARQRRRGIPVFALLLVLVGGVPLLQNLGVIPWEQWRLWPVLIIAFGVNLIVEGAHPGWRPSWSAHCLPAPSPGQRSWSSLAVSRSQPAWRSASTA